MLNWSIVSVYTNKQGGFSIDWRNSEAVREFTRVLLLEDYQINVEIPSDQLCPMVPNRANYIHWLKDLLDLSTPENSAPSKIVRGIDM